MTRLIVYEKGARGRGVGLSRGRVLGGHGDQPAIGEVYYCLPIVGIAPLSDEIYESPPLSPVDP